MATVIVETTAENIRKMLLDGSWQTDDKLPSEMKLAEQFGVGRSTIREALRILAASGYVKIIPNRGALVGITREEDVPSPKSWLMINSDMISDLLSVRLCIEPFATEMCAQNISEEGKIKLKQLLDGFRDALYVKDWKLLTELDLAFHSTILQESQNRFLFDMYKPLLESFTQYSQRSLAVGFPSISTLSEHMAIYEAIIAQSPAEAYAAMLLHLNIAKRSMRLEEK